MAYHVTINGRPLCDHTACVAGLQQAAEAQSVLDAAHISADATTCGHVWRESAIEVARVWRAFKGLDAKVVKGPCPTLPRRLAEAQK